jgi:GAF domain-containing protein
MSNRCCRHCCRDNNFVENDFGDQIQALNQLIAQLVANIQIQEQTQAQAQAQDADSSARTILRDSGNSNVSVEIDNVSVAVAVLVSVGLLTGVLDGAALQPLLDRLLARQ